MMANMMNLLLFVPRRSFSVSQRMEGKRNFKKFMLANKRGPRIFKQQQFENPDPRIPFYARGVRETGFKMNDRFHIVPEMIPQLVVPDLKDCNLKPYVSYKVPDVTQPEFTAQELFEAVYTSKIKEDFKKGDLDFGGNPLKPSPEEQLTAKEAYISSRKTGSDIF